MTLPILILYFLILYCSRLPSTAVSPYGTDQMVKLPVNFLFIT